MSNKSYKKKIGHCPPVVYNNNYWKQNKYMIDNGTDFVWDNIEKPIVDSFTPEKNVWWAIGENNKYFPQLDIFSLSRIEQLVHIIIHIFIWVSIFYLFYNKYPISCIIFSVLGLLTQLIYDFFKESNFYFSLTNISTNSDGTNKSIFTITHSDKQMSGTSVLGKNSIYTFNDSEGYVLKPDVIKNTSNNNKIPMESLSSWYKETCNNNNDGVSNLDAFSSADPKTMEASFYVISAIITIGIIQARITGKSIKSDLSLIIGISGLTLICIYMWRFDFTAEEVQANRHRRDKLLIESITISLFYCSIILFRNK